MIDLLFCAKGRPEFTRESLAALLRNTNLGSTILGIFTDGDAQLTSVSGFPDEFVKHAWQSGINFIRGKSCSSPPAFVSINTDPVGGPVGALLKVSKSDGSDIICKIDNDVIVPPGWLEQCLAVMEAHPELDLLGIEPPQSRTANPQTGKRGPEPDREPCAFPNAYGYHQVDSVGGIGLFRRRAFERFPDLRAEGTYGGFTSWQLRHPELVIGWIVPPLKLFLLDRLQMEPWVSLSKRYIAEGQQRPWTNYDEAEAQELAGWWLNASAR